MPAFGVGLEGGVEVYSTSCSQHMKEKDYDNNHDDDNDDDEKRRKRNFGAWHGWQLLQTIMILFPISVHYANMNPAHLKQMVSIL